MMLCRYQVGFVEKVPQSWVCSHFKFLRKKLYVNTKFILMTPNPELCATRWQSVVLWCCNGDKVLKESALFILSGQ